MPHPEVQSAAAHLRRQSVNARKRDNVLETIPEAGALIAVDRIRVEAAPTGEAPIAAVVEAAADRVAAVAGLQVHPADASA